MDTKRTGVGTDIPIVQLLIVAVVTVIVLLPFSGKAFNIDDTLFLWMAKQIHASPFDAYGFSGNWDGVLRPAPEIIKNPPVASYYLALAASIGGFGERALHLAFLLPALAVSLGTYLLARRYTSMPVAAALIAVLSPVFMVSANTVMCDMLILAFWVWAVLLWVRGLERHEGLTLLLAGALVALSALTKYFGASLIPLLAAYSLLERKPVRLWLPGLLIPIAALAGFQWATGAFYGKGFLTDATGYATAIQGEGSGAAGKTFIGLAFTGGCFIAALFYGPLVWSRKVFIAGAAAAIAGVFALSRLSYIGEAPVVIAGAVRWPLVIESAIFAAAGMSLLALTVRDIVKSRSSGSALLAMWVFGTFAFAVFFNWTVNGRSILPLVPAAAIIIVRALEGRGEGKAGLAALFLPLVPCLLVTVSVMWADSSLAGSARTAARHLTQRDGDTGRVWFQGHWGFQYYMEEGGARPVEWGRSLIRRGDIVVFPLNNVNLRLVPGKSVSVIDDLRYATSPGWLATMSLVPGAGFYASEWGPLPYLVGPVNPERYLVMRATEDFLLD